MTNTHPLASHIPHDWQTVLADQLSAPYFHELCTKLTQAYKSETIYPAQKNIFKALELTSIKDVKVVILGQDPYHGPGQAHGLAFSVPADVPIPPSLRNIYKEIQSDIGSLTHDSGDLSAWAKQGVLLLNTSLTVPASDPNGHAILGWSSFSDAIVRTIAERCPHAVFMLWGAHARSKRKLITTEEHLVLEAAHPSPLSAHRGFLGCRHFSQANQYLIAHNKLPITW